MSSRRTRSSRHLHVEECTPNSICIKGNNKGANNNGDSSASLSVRRSARIMDKMSSSCFTENAGKSVSITNSNENHNDNHPSEESLSIGEESSKGRRESGRGRGKGKGRVDGKGKRKLAELKGNEGPEERTVRRSTRRSGLELDAITEDKRSVDKVKDEFQESKREMPVPEHNVEIKTIRRSARRSSLALAAIKEDKYAVDEVEDEIEERKPEMPVSENNIETKEFSSPETRETVRSGMGKREKGKAVLGKEAAETGETIGSSVRSMVRKDKGKAVLKEEAVTDYSKDEPFVKLRLELTDDVFPSSGAHFSDAGDAVDMLQDERVLSEVEGENLPQQNRGTQNVSGMKEEEFSRIEARRMSVRREMFHKVARSRAQHFAFFNTEDGKSEPSSSGQSSGERGVSDQDEEKDWPGPFSTARRLVSERARALAKRQEKALDSGQQTSGIDWEPSRKKDFAHQVSAPSLYDLCLDVLIQHADHIESLEGIPDAARNKICQSFCAHRIMTPRNLRLFITGSPTEICVSDCSLIPEDDLTNMFAECSTNNLEVLKLKFCGRAVSDRFLQFTLLHPSSELSSLTSVSLSGAYRLSDIGLKALVESTPFLTSLDLSSCSLLSERSIEVLAKTLSPVIKELCLDECSQLDALKILPSLRTMQKLEVLSLSRVGSVTDEFLRELLAYIGCELKELYLADCRKLTDGAIAAIGAVCCTLNSLILDDLCNLTDRGLAFLTDGCRSLQTFSCKRCSFSDESIAAYISGSGSCLSNLSLNSVKEVSNQTILALVSTCSRSLSKLDLSWCRSLTDEALGFLADSCDLLQELVLFGCSQITEKFYKGHSNSILKIKR